MESPNFNRVLVTGANGNLARKLVDRLQRVTLRGKPVQFALTDLQASSSARLREGDVYRVLDLADNGALRNIVTEFHPNFLLHFGGMLSSASERDREKAWEINATASFALLEAATQIPACVFFFPSTGATYGSGLPDPLPEDFPQWPANIYGVAKIAVERAGTYFNLTQKLDFRCLRFPMILSPSAPPTAVSAYASRAFVEAKSGKEFIFPVSPTTGISTIYIKDVIEGLHRFLDTPRAQLTRCVYNVHAFGPTAEEIAEAIRQRIPDFRFRFQPDDFVDGLLRGWARVHLDKSARDDWGWAPRFDLAATAEDFLHD